MARIEKNVLGSLSGKVGSVVASRWRGIEYFRSKGAPMKKAFTPAQKEQQARFALVGRFMKAFGHLFGFSYETKSPRMTGRNIAFSELIKNAVVGSFPNYEIDYSKVKISSGTLAEVENGSVSSNTTGVVSFSWVDNSGSIGASSADKAILAVYCPALDRAVVNTAGPNRNVGTGDLIVSAFSNEEIHAWISFSSDDGKQIANSTYLGKVTVL